MALVRPCGDRPVSNGRLFPPLSYLKLSDMGYAQTLLSNGDGDHRSMVIDKLADIL